FILLASSSLLFLSLIFLSASSVRRFASCDFGLEFCSVLGFGAWDFSGAWWPARDSTREDFRSLSELELGALPSPFPPFAPVTSVFICVCLLSFHFALFSLCSSCLCGEFISIHSFYSFCFFLSLFSVSYFFF